MRMRPGNIGRVQHCVRMLSVHEIDEQLPKRLTAGNELPRSFVECTPARNRLQRRLKPPRARGGEFARVQQLLNACDFVARLRAAREVRNPSRLQGSRRTSASGLKLGVVLWDVHFE